jgi:hypothetical protein
MYIVFNVFYFYSGVGQKDSGVGRAHLAPPFATPMLVPSFFYTDQRLQKLRQNKEIWKSKIRSDNKNYSIGRERWLFSFFVSTSNIIVQK